MNKKRFIQTVFMVIFLVSALTVFSFVKDFSSTSTTKAQETNQQLNADSPIDSEEIFCSAQGGTKPPPWDKKDDDDTDTEI